MTKLEWCLLVLLCVSSLALLLVCGAALALHQWVWAGWCFFVAMVEAGLAYVIWYFGVSRR